MKNLIKKSLIAIFILFVTTALNGCGNESMEENLRTYDGGDFTIDINPAWQIMTKSEFYPEIPKEAVVAFTKNEAYNGYYINVSIISEKMNATVSSIDFGRANINLAGKNLTDYKKIQEAKVDLNGTPALIHIFDARLNPTEKLIKFIQLYAVKNNMGYTITGAVPIDTLATEKDQVQAIVTSFKFK